MEEMVFATVIDGIVAFILFLIWQNEREIRGRLLPLCVLTLLHALLYPAMMLCYALHATFFAGNNILWDIYLFSTPVLLVFIIMYSIRLSNRSRMTRPLGISTVIFIINLVVQALFAFLAWVCGQG